MAESLSINDFKAQMQGGGVRSNLYKVTPIFQGGGAAAAQLATFMIKSAALPGYKMGTIPVKYRGREIKLIGDQTFEDWTIDVINDADFKVRDAFSLWFNSMNDKEDNVSSFKALNDYQATWLIQQLDRAGEVIKTYQMHGCFPIDMSKIDVGNDKENEIETFSVTMTYQYWTEV